MRRWGTMAARPRYPVVLAVLGLVALGLLAAACGGGPDFQDPLLQEEAPPPQEEAPPPQEEAPPPQEEVSPLQEFDDQFTTPGQPHLQTGQAASYPTTPPYGGPHWSQPLRCGIYEADQRFEPLVHTMEHGAVVLYYQPLVHDADAVAEIRVVVLAMLGDGARLIMTPSTQLSQAIVVASWGRLLPMPEFNEEALRGFVDAFEGDAPENVGC